MDLAGELESESAPKIRKAARKIGSQRIEGYESLLLSALKRLIDKPNSWQTQSELIRAIGITGSLHAVPYLKELAARDLDAIVLYKDLGFAICRLNDLMHSDLKFLKSILSGNNELLVAGSCSALLYEKSIPSESDMLEIMEAIKFIDTNEGQVITPRCYIAALAYLWPPATTKPFLELCMQSNWNGLVEISKSSLNGEKPTCVLV